MTPAADLSFAEARALLEWSVAMGVDEAIDEVGLDRFALVDAAPVFTPQVAVAQSETARRPVTPVPPAPGAAARGAAAVAAAAESLDALRAALEAFDGCGLKQTATRLVFADGTPGSRVMLIGEAPGREEDREGLPFVGKSGQLLDRMLATVGLDRASVYIANVVPWRPPGNRTPTPQELEICLPFVRRQIELAKPEMLVLLGNAAFSAMTGSSQGIMRARGNWTTARVADRELPTLPTLHPAHLLRSPIAKRLVWRDLQALRKALG